MKRKVISVFGDATIGQAAAILVEQHIGSLPVVVEENRLVGLLQLRDVLSLVMPDFVHLVETFNFLRDFGAVESRQPSAADMKRKVREIMQPPIAVEETSGLLRAFSLLHKYNMLDLPIVDSQNRLVGIASRVDIGTALLAGWRLSGEGQSP